METYIHQLMHWPQFTWNNDAIITLLSNVRNKQGLFMGKIEAIGFNLQNETYLETLSQDVTNGEPV